jgi:hypothetical protein
MATGGLVLHNLTVEEALHSLTNLERELIFYLIGREAAAKERIRYAQYADASGA